jgi:hypothetical protein
VQDPAADGSRPSTLIHDDLVNIAQVERQRARCEAAAVGVAAANADGERDVVGGCVADEQATAAAVNGRAMARGVTCGVSRVKMERAKEKSGLDGVR